jgi:hypothetical protein
MPMASRIRDLLILTLPSEWGAFGGGMDAASPGPNPPPPGPPDAFTDFDSLQLRMIAQLILAELGGPVTLAEMEPRSMEDLNELEGRLTAALEDVKSMRANFEAD